MTSGHELTASGVPRSGHWKYWGAKPVPICLPCKSDPSIPDVREWLQDIGCCCTYCMKIRMKRAVQ